MMKIKLNKTQTDSIGGSIGTQKPVRFLAAMIVALGVFSNAMVVNANSFTANANLPTDAKPTCEAKVSDWFPEGRITQNGWVEPANSLDPIFANFESNTRCDFYKWGAQMFLWLTSGIDDQHVFNFSPGFYNVSVESDGKRSFLTGDGMMLLGVRKGKTDDEIELGQAGGGDVLISQKNSLVYYGLHVNDIYALYSTGSQVQSTIKLPSHFPSTQSEVDAVAKFAKSYGYPMPNLKTMAIELKTSWVDASTVGNKNNYVHTKAIVPKFDRSKPKGPWPVNGNEEKTLALVGMHVVGTVNGHPEMVWSTFEHVDNVPDNTYTYTNTKGRDAQHSFDSAGNWNFLFLPSRASAPSSITANAKVDAAKNSSQATAIVASPSGSTIEPINILRVDPWGNQHGDNSSSNVSNNTDLVSINVSVLSQLKAGDIRGNYIQTGGIWTAKGHIPVSGTDPNLRGSLNLANTTMETFYQFHNSEQNAFNPKNCFGCHSSPQSEATDISHIFDALQPLPRK